MSTMGVVALLQVQYISLSILATTTEFNYKNLSFSSFILSSSYMKISHGSWYYIYRLFIHDNQDPFNQLLGNYLDKVEKGKNGAAEVSHDTLQHKMPSIYYCTLVLW